MFTKAAAERRRLERNRERASKLGAALGIELREGQYGIWSGSFEREGIRFTASLGASSRRRGLTFEFHDWQRLEGRYPGSPDPLWSFRPPRGGVSYQDPEFGAEAPNLTVRSRDLVASGQLAPRARAELLRWIEALPAPIQLVMLSNTHIELRKSHRADRDEVEEFAELIAHAVQAPTVEV